MGKAILMLLGEIETLKETLERSELEPLEVAETAPAPDQPDTRTTQDDDTATLNLRERLRAATHRQHD